MGLNLYTRTVGTFTVAAVVWLSASLSFAHESESHEGPAPEPTPPAEAPAAEDAKDPENPLLRFADRRQVVFRLGFGGTFKRPVLGDSKAEPTYGATLRWDRPVHEYVTTGLGLSFYANKPEDEFREPAIDIEFFLKGRYPFEMGKKERKFESEIYLIFEVGFTIWIDSTDPNLNLIGPGWIVGLAPGYQFFINERVGLLTEVGWVRIQAFFAQGQQTITVNQASVRIGAVFPF